MTIVTLNEFIAFLNVKAVEILSTVNNRDIAILLWAAIGISFAMTNKDIRSSISSFVKCALQPSLVATYSIMVMYTIVMLLFLDSYGLFTSYQVKYVIIWFFTVAFIPLIKHNQFQENMALNAWIMVKSGLTYLACISFYVGLYPFNIWIELLVGVPLILTLGAIRAVAEIKKIPNITPAVNFCFLIIFLTVTIWTGNDIYAHPESYTLKELSLNFGVPIMLTVLYVPFAIFFTVYCVYDLIFKRLGISIEDEAVTRYAKIASLVVFNLNTKSAARWFKMLGLRDRQTISDINASLIDMVKVRWSEVWQKPVDKSKGWSPACTRMFLEDFDLKTGTYDWVSDNVLATDAVASIDPPNGDLNNQCTLAFYTRGMVGCVKSLALKLFVTNTNDLPEQSETQNELIEYFFSVAEVLWSKALGGKIPDDLASSIIECRSTVFQGRDFDCRIDFDAFGSSYAIKISIKKDNWIDYY